MTTSVSIVKCDTYHEDTVKKQVKEAVDLLGGMKNFVAPGEKVLLKPNLVAGRPPEKCATTHPMVVKAVAQLVSEAGAVPLIGDSPQLGLLEKTVGKNGVKEIAGDLGIEIVEFEPFTVPCPNARKFKSFTIGKILTEVDKVINIPKLKTHALTTFTLAVKNLFGSVPSIRKAEWHLKTFHGGQEYFSQMLLDLYTLINPVLNIIDGVMAMEGMGPGFGDPRHLGLFIAGTDAVAVDRVVVDMLNVQAHMVPVLDVALREGYGVGKLEDISIVGEKLADVRVLDFKLSPREDPFMKIPIPIKKFLKTYLTNHPTIIQKKCEVCKLCLQACPMKCISCENNKVKIHNKNCIKCLCCLEACPHAAVGLKPGGLLKAYQAIRKVL